MGCSPNNSIDTAQSLDSSFSLQPNSNIESSDTIPHVSITSTGDGTFDYYSFTATVGSTGIFDIDTGNAAPVSSGNGGNITLRASGNITTNGSLNSSSFSSNGGAISLQAGSNLSVSNSFIDSSSFGSSVESKAGVIHLDAETVTLKNIGIYAVSFEDQGGDVTITATATSSQRPAIQLVDTWIEVTRKASNPQQVNSHSNVGNEGNGGNITLTANNSDIELSNAQIVTESGRLLSGEAGNITVSANSLFMGNESRISAGAIGNANGGNITINTPLLVVWQPTGPNGSDIMASAVSGNGGIITINSQGIFGIRNFQVSGVIGIDQRKIVTGNRTNDIDASSELGVSGEVEIKGGFDPSQGLTEFSSKIDPTPQISQGCSGSQRVAEGENKFTVTGRGGLPSSPDDLFSGDRVLTDLGTPAIPTASRTTDTSTAPLTRSPASLVEAQSWFIDANGVVHLVAASSNATPQNHWQPPVQCSGS